MPTGEAGTIAPEVGTDRDAVVIGGGLAGVLTALRLAERGPRVALFEARSVASRTTGHSTAPPVVGVRLPVDRRPALRRSLAPGSQRRFVATAFGKWGMSTSMVAADVIADLIDGRDNPTAEILDARRILPTVGRTMVKNNAKVAKRFVGDRVAALHSSEERLAPGTGVVVRRGSSLVAMACDMAGQTHMVGAACTHLGCIVGFNAGEQTWDCPCHGSRFTVDGEVLDGPAREPLPPWNPSPTADDTAAAQRAGA